MSANEAQIIAVIGSTGSGKSGSIKGALAPSLGWRHALKLQRPRRVIVWDRMREYSDFGQVVTSANDLLAAVKTKGGKVRAQFAVIVQPPAVERRKMERLFSLVCSVAQRCGHTLLVAEELPQVTRPGWAPAGWSEALLTGRHAGMAIIGTAQRPALMDKDIFSQATIIRCGRLNYDDDVKAMAKALCVSPVEIRNLKPLEAIERDMTSGETRKFSIIPPK